MFIVHLGVFSAFGEYHEYILDVLSSSGTFSTFGDIMVHIGEGVGGGGVL